ncbi:hypothetical protein, partial [Serratia marcescens]|uniref:hypothetical protein n=1 Tax=Serratia marcescens TaxID=615 RepID=UPI001F16FE90
PRQDHLPGPGVRQGPAQGLRSAAGEESQLSLLYIKRESRPGSRAGFFVFIPNALFSVSRDKCCANPMISACALHRGK